MTQETFRYDIAAFNQPRIQMTKIGIRETNEQTMIAAHQAGMAYWKRNKPDTTRKNLEFLARSCGWHGEDNTAWLAGFYGAKRRSETNGI